MRTVLLAVISISCAGAAPMPAAEPSDRPVPTTSPPPTGATASGPGTTAPCLSDGEVRATLDRFIAAFDSGSSDLVEAAISRHAQWFSLTLPSGHEVAYGQNAIARHLIERYRAGDRLEGPRIRVNELVGWDGSAQFEVTAMQLTRDGSMLQVRGKGALQCRGWGEGIVVLSLGPR